MIKPKLYKIGLFLLLLGIFSCSKKLQLKENENLLYLNIIKGSKKYSNSDLEPYIKQRPNKRILGVRLSMYAYNFGRQFYDSSRVYNKLAIQNAYISSKQDSLQKNDSAHYTHWLRKQERKQSKLARQAQEGNWWMRTFGSKPVVFDSSLASQTQKLLHAFLKSKGFLNNQVSYKTDTLFAKNIVCMYYIIEGNLYAIDSVFLQIEDEQIRWYVKEQSFASLLKKGDPLDQAVLLAERDRIDKLLKDKGYFDFQKDLISFEIDTMGSAANVAVNIKTSVDKPLVRYTVNSIEVNVDQPEFIQDTTQILHQTTIGGVVFKLGNVRYQSTILREKIPLSTNTYYSFTESQRTLRYLSQLEVFKYVNLRYQKDTSNAKLKAFIFTQSAPKYLLTDEIGMSVTQGLPGPFGSVTFSSRNALRIAEIFDISLRAGIEGVAGAADQRNIYRSAEINAVMGLTFPRVMGIWGLNRLFINNNPKTRFSASYGYVIRPEYRRYSLRFNMNYLFFKDKYKQISISLLDINSIYNPYLEPSWNRYLIDLYIQQGNNLIRSFQNTIVPSLNASYTFNNLRLGQNTNANFLRLYGEVGGTTLNLLPQSWVQSLEESFNLNAIFVYWKINADMRTYVPVSKTNSVALRANIGLANPYAGDRVLPYERYFFTGGSNSNRAWLPRRLGPGSFANTFDNGRIDYRYEQPGLVLLELNAEYRFAVYRFLDGALFTDAGNVWNLNDTDSRKNIKSDSWSEIAIGSGFGLRFNFSFLIVRFDVAAKTYDPSRSGTERWVIRNISAKRPFYEPGQVLLNIAVGYPF